MLLWLLSWTAVAAQDAGTLHDLHHTAWTLKDGAPPDIWALAQTRDGYLWLGTGAGLYRFDGVRFQRIPAALHSSNITALLVDREGTLWIGSYFGDVAMLRAGASAAIAADDGMPAGTIFRFAQTPDGVLWAASSGGLIRRDGSRWQAVGSDRGYPAPRANWLLVDRDGVLWVSTGETLMRLRPGASRFEPTGQRSGTAVLAEAPDGRLWQADDVLGLRALPVTANAARAAPPSPNAPSRRTVPLAAKRLLFDRTGALWGTDGVQGGVFRIPDPSAVPTDTPLAPASVTERFHRGDGLTAEVAVPLLEDREGSIWVGTNLGLNRFRRNPFHAEGRVPEHSPFGYALAGGDDGPIVAYGDRLQLLGRPSTQALRMPLEPISALYRSPRGSLWIGGPGRLLRIDGGAPVEVVLPPQIGTDIVQAIAEDGDGRLWIAIGAHGTYRQTDTGWQRADEQYPALPPDAALVMQLDSHQRLWLGYAGNRIGCVSDDSARLLGAVQGLAIGNVASFAETPDGMLAGGESGLARLQDERVVSIGNARIEAFTGISGLLRTPDGSLWLNGLQGVAQIEAAALHAAFDSEAPLPMRLYNYEDGLPGVAQQSNPVPTAAQTRDGRLWFATNRGLAWIDPSRLHRNTLAPTVAIDGIIAGGQRYAALPQLQLPRGTTGVQIDYAGLSLAIPERVRFRYRLDAPAEDWQDAATRRQAIYTNLAPGAHRFELIAANEDGVWSAPAALTFTIEPAFFQTGWFRALCVLAALLALWMLYLLRLRQLTLRLRMRLEARHEERERIARELHDTLLQGVQGLILRVHAIAQRMPASEARTSIEQTLDHAEGVIEQARDRVRALRDAARPAADLAEALAAFGRECAAIHDVSFSVRQQFVARALNPLARDEIWQIGREALFNAFQHAQARSIEVELVYGLDALRLKLRDDGIGMAAEVLSEGREGHWGLAGMRERARRLRGELQLWSRPGLGTEIELVVPAALAYRGRQSRSWALRLLGLDAGESPSR